MVEGSETRVMHLLYFSPKSPGGVSSMIPHLAEVQRAQGVPARLHWSPLAFSQGLTVSGILSYRTRLATLALPPGTVLHAHHPLAAIAAHAWMPGTGRILPLVFTVHGVPSPLEQPFLRQAMNVANLNVTVSRYLARVLLQLPGQTIQAVVYNGVDVEHRFHPRTLTPIDRGIRLVTVSRVAPEKGLVETAAVYLELLRQRVPVQWTIVGDGTERAKVLRYLRKNGALRQVRWTGFQECPEDWLQRGNLFLLLSNQEAFGNAFIEANSMGLPTVASRVGGILEHLTDGYNGFSVDPGDVSRIHTTGRMIAALYRTPRRWEALRRGSIVCGLEFSLHKMAREYRAIYGWANESTIRIKVKSR